MNKVFRLLTAAVFAVVSLSGVAIAQTAATGNIEGIVTDTTGAVLPGVSVVVKNTATNVTRDLVTDEAGRYRANALQPGVYEVTATLGGFQTATFGNLQVPVGQTLAADIKMRAAGVTETVTVTAESPLIDTRRTDVSNVVDETAIENLPINGRRWENFVLLGPAVTNDGNFGLVSYRGISGLYNNNTVDGADNNQAFFSEARGRTRTSYSISQAAIKEFQVGVSNFSAEFGRAAGGTVNAITKSGTNAFRGEAFYFLRDDKFTSKDPFFPAGIDRPDERRQQYGVSAGGPIQSDKVFYFVNYDGQRRNFPYFVRPGQSNFITGACTAPGCASTVAFYNGLSVFNPREGNNDIFLGKVDFTASNKHTFTAQYNMHRWDSPNGVQTQPVISVSPSANGKDVVKTDFALFSVNSVVSDRWLNEARVQIGRDFEAQEPNTTGGPGTTVTGGIDIGIPNFLPRPKYPDERRYQFVDNVTWYAGAHSVKSGFDINYVQEDLINLFQGAGIYAYPNINAIASDCPRVPGGDAASGCTPLITGTASDSRHYTSYNQAFDLRGAGFAGDVSFPTTDYNLFVQDNWRVNNQLTLNLGVRWEYQKFPQPTETETKGVKFTGNPDYPATVTFNQDKNNFGPRVGFTYDINGSHTTVIRGGWGIYYGRSSNSVISSALTNNAKTFASYNFTPTSPGAPQYPFVFPAPPATAARPSIQYLSPTLERPEINMAEMTVDRAIGTDITVSASYLYSKGKHLPTFVDTNLNPPNSTVDLIVDGQSRGTFPFYRGSRPDANLNNAIEVADIVESTYNALVLQLNKRFNKGLLFNANYTLSKAEDTGQNSTTFISNFATMVDPFNNDAEQGPASFDRRHRGVVSVHYAPEFLWGFQIGGTGTFESGLPLNPTITINSGAMTAAGPTNTASVNGSGASNRAPFDTRNGFRQTSRKTIDMRVSKRFNVGGRRQIEALWEAFNLFNTTNYTGFGTTKYNAVSSSYDPATNRAVVNLTSNTGFGVPTTASNTLFGPRDMQIGFKFLW
jgi:carboxypeptidase family protein